MSKKPFRYERTGKDTFRLWSVGWDGKDEQGIQAYKDTVKREQDFHKGDWAWPSSVKSQATP